MGPPDLEALLPGSYIHQPDERRRLREEREVWGPRPGLMGLPERGVEGDLELLGVSSGVCSAVRCFAFIDQTADLLSFSLFWDRRLDANKLSDHSTNRRTWAITILNTTNQDLPRITLPTNSITHPLPLTTANSTLTIALPLRPDTSTLINTTLIPTVLPRIPNSKEALLHLIISTSSSIDPTPTALHLRILRTQTRIIANNRCLEDNPTSSRN
jgi:hypothetical protein